MSPKDIRRIGNIGSTMAQYKSVKVTSEDYDALKRYMHLGFHDTMSEAFHNALNTALFEEYGEGVSTKPRMKVMIDDLTARAQANAEERDFACSMLNMTVPELHMAQLRKEIIPENSKGVKKDVSHSKRNSKRKTKGERP